MILFLFFIFFQTQTQAITWTCEAEYLYGDHLDQWYAIKGSQIEKRDSQGRLMSTYSAPSLGPIEYLDVSNPLKPFIFYPELGKIVYLNTMMAAIEPSIDLFEFPGQITTASGSVGQHIWLYDSNQISATRYDQFLKPVATTGPITAWVGQTWTTKKMVEQDGLVYLWNGETRILVVDLFGNYMREMIVKDSDDLWITSEGIIRTQDGNIYFHREHVQDEIKLNKVPLKDAQKVALSAKYLATYNGKVVMLVRGEVLGE